MNHSLSDDEIEAVLGIKPNEVIPYSDLKNYNHIDELLPSFFSFKIILLKSSQNYGHWIAILRNPKSYYFFNSYGYKYDTHDWDWITRMTRRILGQEDNELQRLFKDVPNQWNPVRFQGKGSTTCGRWVCLFCIYCGKMMYTLDEFINKMKSEKKKYPKLSYDEICVQLTDSIKPS